MRGGVPVENRVRSELDLTEGITSIQVEEVVQTATSLLKKIHGTGQYPEVTAAGSGTFELLSRSHHDWRLPCSVDNHQIERDVLTVDVVLVHPVSDGSLLLGGCCSVEVVPV